MGVRKDVERAICFSACAITVKANSYRQGPHNVRLSPDSAPEASNSPADQAILGGLSRTRYER
jgi:hypothetical protein